MVDRALQVVRQIGVSPQNIASFGTDERGEVYLVGYEGMIYHLDFSATRFDEIAEPGTSSVHSVGTEAIRGQK